MPADYSSTARALALPISPPTSPFEYERPQVSWRHSSENVGLRALRHEGTNVRDHAFHYLAKTYRRLFNTFGKMTPLQLGLSCLLGGLSITLAILFLFFSEKIFAALHPVAEGWKNLKGGWLILWGMTFMTAFPPVIGYSTCLTLAGFIYGFPTGWPIVASATIAGSTCSFLLARTLFSQFVKRLVSNDKRFEALSLVLKHDGLKLLIMIRLCPLPYSISNGAISTFPTVSPLMFALATTVATPKLLIAIFIGSRLAAIARSGEKMDAATKTINWISIALSVSFGIITGYLIYQRTIARSRHIEAEDSCDAQGPANLDNSSLDIPEDQPMSTTFCGDDHVDFLEHEESTHRYCDEELEVSNYIGDDTDDDKKGASGMDLTKDRPIYTCTSSML